jgi:folate-binding protein YgfZ
MVVVRGTDATSFLQSIVSQDLAPVAVGETVASLLLHPQGKLDVAFRATRRASGDDGDEWWLDTEPHVAERLAAGLSRFRIRVKVDIVDRSPATAMASVVGAERTAPSDLVVTGTAWGERPGTDLVGPADVVAAWIAGSGLRVGSPAELEVLRIEAGIPRHGIDVDDSTIPQEAFLERDAVSFTKGCFIGQELVCRIDSRGHVNRFLRRLAIAGEIVPPHGADVLHDRRAVGTVTSAVAVPGEGRVVALAMIRREVDPPAEVTVTVAGHEVPATLLP